MNDRFKVTRRSFLKTSLTVSAALAVRHASAEDELQPVRLGMIGMGNRGNSLLGTLLEFPGVEIRAVCDLLPDRAQNATRVLCRQRAGLGETGGAGGSRCGDHCHAVGLA
jgi:predicted homoserine dehydrogenase-like protein